LVVTFITTLIALWLLPCALYSQGPAAVIIGQAVIAGPDGQRLGAAGAEMRLESVSIEEVEGQPEESEPASVQTDRFGNFRFAGVAPGCYIIVGEAPGLSGQSDIVCLPSEAQPLRIDIEMEVDTVVESVEVTASTIEIDPTQTSSSGSVGVSTMDNAPKVNRSIEDVMPLIPGVLRGEGGQINMNGVRASQSGSQLNNVDITDPVGRTSEIGLPLSVVSAVEVLSTPYDAQYGGFVGAVSTVETRAADLEKFRFDLQNFIPRTRRRDGSIVGIESSTPRLTVNIPLKNGRFGLLHSTEYQFVRTDQEDANLPLLERDVEREALTVFNQFDAQVTDRNHAAATVVVYPEKLNFFGLNAFTPQQSTPDLRRRGVLVALKDSHEFESGGLLLSNLSYQELDGDVKPLSYDPSVIGLERASGAFFSRQARNTIRRKLSEHYHFAPVGKHQLKTGVEFGVESYSGDQTYNSVTWLGIDDRPVSELRFTPPTTVRASKNDFSMFLQDKWSASASLTFDLGARLERDSIAGDWNPSYRAGFAYAFGGETQTVLRGGTGLFIDRVSLLVPTFESLPQRIATRFGPGGEDSTVRFIPRIDGGIRNARTFGWSLQLDRELVNNLFFRAGYQQRRTTRNFLVNPILPSGPIETDGALTLSNSGRDYYREYEVTVRYRLTGTGHLTTSYVHSSAVGDLNDLSSVYGPPPVALIRPNERAPLPFDVPNRLVTWAEVGLPWGLVAIPVWELRSGFPYSNVNEDRDFVGARNRAGRFPIFNTIDLQVTKKVALKYRGRTRRFRVGLRLFNLLNTFNPQDLQANLASPNYGTYYRGVKRKIRAVIEFGN